MEKPRRLFFCLDSLSDLVWNSGCSEIFALAVLPRWLSNRVCWISDVCANRQLMSLASKTLARFSMETFVFLSITVSQNVGIFCPLHWTSFVLGVLCPLPDQAFCPWTLVVAPPQTLFINLMLHACCFLLGWTLTNFEIDWQHCMHMCQCLNGTLNNWKVCTDESKLCETDGSDCRCAGLRWLHETTLQVRRASCTVSLIKSQH